MGIDWEYLLDAEGEDLVNAYEDSIPDDFGSYDDDYYYDDYYAENDNDFPPENEPECTYNNESCYENNKEKSFNDIDEIIDRILSSDVFLDRLIDRLQERFICRLSADSLNKLMNSVNKGLQGSNNMPAYAKDECYGFVDDDGEVLPF